MLKLSAFNRDRDTDGTETGVQTLTIDSRVNMGRFRCCYDPEQGTGKIWIYGGDA